MAALSWSARSASCSPAIRFHRVPAGNPPRAVVRRRSGRRLTAMIHEAVAKTSSFEEYQETSSTGPACSTNATTPSSSYKLARLDRFTPGDMRARVPPRCVRARDRPWTSSLMRRRRSARASAPQLRRADPNEDKAFTNKDLRKCYAQGAEQFGWSRRKPQPRSMREGRELSDGAWPPASGKRCSCRPPRPPCSPPTATSRSKRDR